MKNKKTLLEQFQQLEYSIQQLSLEQDNWFNESDIFVSSAFSSRSNELSTYLLELKSNIEKLSKLSDPDYMEFLADKITQQFSSLRSFINSHNINDKDKQYKKQHFSKVQRVKQFAKQAAHSSQSLYEELSKLQEYERRLLDMVAEKQKQLSMYQGNQLKAQYQQDVLTCQQRLGRCRQALSKVEEQIQKLDEKN